MKRPRRSERHESGNRLETFYTAVLLVSSLQWSPMFSRTRKSLRAVERVAMRTMTKSGEGAGLSE